MEKQSLGHKAFKTIGFMAVMILLAKFSGLFKESLIASLYGTTTEADVLATVAYIPPLFFELVLGAAVTSAFIPIFNDYLKNDGRERAFAFANNFLNIVVLITFAATILGMIFTLPISKAIANDAAQITQISFLLRIFFPAIVFTGLAFVAVGILQSLGEFNVPAIISLLSNGLVIVYLYVFGTKYGLAGIVVAMLIGWSLQFFVQVPSLIKKKFKYKFSMNFRDKGLKSSIRLAGPALVGSWQQPICLLISMRFALALGEGSWAGFGYANKLYIIVVMVLASTVASFVFPKLSRLSAGGDDDGFADTTNMSLNMLLYVIVPVSFLFMALAVPIISLVYERGEFGAESVGLASTALMYLSPGMVGFAVCEVLNKSFYAMKDGVTPMVASIAGIVVNIASAFLMVNVWRLGLAGVALATALSSTVAAAALIIIMARKRPGMFDWRFAGNLGLVLVCGGLAFFAAKASYGFVDIRLGNEAAGIARFGWTLAKLAVSGGMGLITYFAAGLIFKVSQAKSVIALMKKGGEV